ncbi:GNAT family N-acetyltransferase [Neobacillus niacini]|uniref:GNAT family N-acetyltransferase n=1 Tax=Neobacillus niacini TaxID=86668 RepID=UPI0021CB9259|nr:GNAT family N-acetyltransferase [Neobacillus niacini]MCM3764497.1 GNAT family N-acetyltransferase [Neobacillus niacini]
MSLVVLMKVLKEGFEATDEVANGFRIINEAILNRPEYGTHFLARLDGEVVAVSSVIYLAGVAGIYNVATLEKARGKGIGTAITKQPLFEAKSKGYQLAILHSSDLGFNIYKNNKT